MPATGRVCQKEMFRGDFAAGIRRKKAGVSRPLRPEQ
jgi:hypothetical protein